MNDHCIFCKIIRGENPAEIIYRDGQVIAFHDIHPVSPVHLLVVPNRHISSVNETGEADELLLGHMLNVARQLAAEFGVDGSGYRLVINTGADAGQSVDHLHLHLLGGKHVSILARL